MGVIKDGYYYPRPEEIFIGYQCEVNWNLGYDPYYKPEVVTLKRDGAYLHDIEELTIAMDDRYAECRVQLLSKEDITSLGWEESDLSNDPHIVWTRGNFFLSSTPTGILIRENKEGYVDIRYHGKCPTINELRKIMDLLEIK